MQLFGGSANGSPPLWSLCPLAGGPLRVLVAEPNAAVRRQIGRALRRAGIHAEFAGSAERALRLLESKAFDVVVVDPSMGRWRGLDVCRSAARTRVAGPLPVVTLAASRSVLCALRSRLAGARMHLSRPVRLEEFVAGVWSAGSRWRGAGYGATEAV